MARTYLRCYCKSLRQCSSPSERNSFLRPNLLKFLSWKIPVTKLLLTTRDYGYMDKLPLDKLLREIFLDEITIDAGKKIRQCDAICCSGAVDNGVDLLVRYTAEASQRVCRICATRLNGDQIIHRLVFICGIRSAIVCGVSALHHRTTEQLVIATTIGCQMEAH